MLFVLMFPRTAYAALTLGAIGSLWLAEPVLSQARGQGQSQGQGQGQGQGRQGRGQVQAQTQARNPGTVTTSRRDSAGIQILESTISGGPPPPAAFVVDTTPMLRISEVTIPAPPATRAAGAAGRAGAAAASGAAGRAATAGARGTQAQAPQPAVATVAPILALGGARVLRSGAIVIGDDGRRTISLYTRFGAHVRTVGPEVNANNRIWSVKTLDSRGDSIIVCCAPGVMLFSGTGNFLAASTPFREEYLGVMHNGRYLVRRTSSETAAYQGQKGVIKSLLTDTLFLVDARGNFGSRIAVLPSRIHTGVYNPDPNPLSMTIAYLGSPFEPESYYAPCRDGFCYTDGRRLEVQVYNAAGRPTRIMRLNAPPVAVSAAMVNEFRSAILIKQVPEARSYIQWVLDEYLTPSQLPLARDMKVARDGRIWLKEHRFPEGPTSVWHIFGTLGAHEGVVELPSRWRVHQVDAEFILASSTAKTGVTEVTLHRVTPR